MQSTELYQYEKHTTENVPYSRGLDDYSSQRLAPSRPYYNYTSSSPPPLAGDDRGFAGRSSPLIDDRAFSSRSPPRYDGIGSPARAGSPTSFAGSAQGTTAPHAGGTLWRSNDGSETRFESPTRREYQYEAPDGSEFVYESHEQTPEFEEYRYESHKVSVADPLPSSAPLGLLPPPRSSTPLASDVRAASPYAYDERPYTSPRSSAYDDHRGFAPYEEPAAYSTSRASPNRYGTYNDNSYLRSSPYQATAPYSYESPRRLEEPSRQYSPTSRPTYQGAYDRTSPIYSSGYNRPAEEVEEYEEYHSRKVVTY